MPVDNNPDLRQNEQTFDSEGIDRLWTVTLHLQNKSYHGESPYLDHQVVETRQHALPREQETNTEHQDDFISTVVLVFWTHRLRV